MIFRSFGARAHGDGHTIAVAMIPAHSPLFPEHISLDFPSPAHISDQSDLSLPTSEAAERRTYDYLPGIANCLALIRRFFAWGRLPYGSNWHPKPASKFVCRGCYDPLIKHPFQPPFFSGSILGAVAWQRRQRRRQSVVSTAVRVTPASDDVPDIALDPASLLPDLAARFASRQGQSYWRHRAKAGPRARSGYGADLRRWQDEGCIRYAHPLFIATASTGSASGLQKPGDRVYLDTILDGSTVFSRSIRVKTTNLHWRDRGNHHQLSRRQRRVGNTRCALASFAEDPCHAADSPAFMVTKPFPQTNSCRERWSL